MDSNDFMPGLAEAVYFRLSAWRNEQPFLSIMHFSEDVQELILAQDNLGWDAFCFGIVDKKWSKYQGDYLKSLGKLSSGTSSVSRLIRQVWSLQHKMWLHRNSFVHKDGGSGHQAEVDAVDMTIWREFLFGRDGLSQAYAGLFRGDVNQLLEKGINMKQQWLYRVWAGRDCLRLSQGLDLWFRDPLASAFIRRHEVRMKRKRGIG